MMLVLLSEVEMVGRGRALALVEDMTGSPPALMPSLLEEGMRDTGRVAGNTSPPCTRAINFMAWKTMGGGGGWGKGEERRGEGRGWKMM